MQLSPQRRRESIVFVGVTLIYILFWLWMPKPSFWGLDNGIKYQGAQSFSDNGNIKIPYAGAKFDDDGKFRPLASPFGILRGNYQIPTFPIIFMVSAGMFAAMFGKIGPHLLSLLGGLVTLSAGWMLWTYQRPKRSASVYILLLAFASPLLFYSMTLWEHTWAMALVLLSFVALFQSYNQSSDSITSQLLLVASGFAISLGAAMRTEAVIWVLVTLLFWKQTGRNKKAVPLYLLGILFGMGIGALLNLLFSGQLIPLHLTTNVEGQQFQSAAGMIVAWIRNFYVALFTGFHRFILSFAGLVPLAALLFRRKWRRNRRAWLWISIAIGVTFSFYWIKVLTATNHPAYMSVSGGLFWIVPVAILALTSFKGEKRPMVNFLWIGCALYIVLYSIASPTSSGIHWGARLILTAVPLVLFLATIRLRRWWKSVKEARVLIVVLIVFSVVGQIYSLFALHDVRADNRELNRWIANAGSTPIVTSMWWMAGDCALQSHISPWYNVKSATDLEELIGLLRDNGVKRFNYLEKPPFIDENQWQRLGVKMLAEDYLNENDRQLRQTWLKILKE